MFKLARNVVLAAGLFAVAPAYGQEIRLTQVPGRLECSTDKWDVCHRQLGDELRRKHPGIVRTNPDGTTSVQVAGRWSKIAPDFEFPACWRPVEFTADDRHVIVTCIANESEYWILADLKSGAQIHFHGYPYLSPNGQHAVVARRNDMAGHLMDMFELDGGKAHKVLQGLASNNYADWWPSDVCWASNETVAYMRNSTRQESPFRDVIERRPEYLHFADGRWRVQTIRPPDARSCDPPVS
jgi:hypothetical protein